MTTPFELKKVIDRNFTNHKATLTDGDVAIIDWRNENNSNDYYIRYILDKPTGTLIINGYFGTCMICWDHKLTAHEMTGLATSDALYFVDKAINSSGLFDFSRYNIRKDIIDNIGLKRICKFTTESSEFSSRKEIIDFIENEIEKSSMVLANATGRFIPTDKLSIVLNQIDCDSFIWLQDCGREIHSKVYYWIEGLKAACHQLSI